MRTLVISSQHSPFPTAPLSYIVKTMLALSITILVLLFILWNVTFLGYKEKKVTTLPFSEEQPFTTKAQSITLKQGSQKAILLIHGFPSTPSLYRYSAQRFFDEGWDVYAPLIPTFGSDPKEFENTTFPQWFAFISDYYENLRATYPTLHILGTSMGGMMALKLGEIYCPTNLAPEKIVTIAAPVVYNSVRDRIFTDKRAYFMRTIALFKASINAKTVDGIPTSDDGNEEWVGYGGLFMRAGLSLIYAMKDVRKNLGSITCPLFAIHDKGDKTVPFANLALIEQHNKSRSFTSLATQMEAHKHNRHALLLYRSIQKELTTRIIAFLQDEEIRHG